MNNNTEMVQYAIYFNVTDYPGKFVVRPWIITNVATPVNEITGTADTIEEARNLVPPGMFRIPRSENDDKVIVETWI